MASPANNAAYYAAHKEKELERGRRWKQAHREKCRDTERKYWASRPHKRWIGILRDDSFPFDHPDYDRAFKNQMGVCLICRRPPKPGRRLAVDHDHHTMKFRALLCFPCNARIGIYEAFKAQAEMYLSGGQ